MRREVHPAVTGRANRSAWHTGDVPGIVAEIKNDWEESEKPYASRLSRGTHARVRAFSMIRAIARTPEHDGRGVVDESATRDLIIAILDALDIIDTELREEREREDAQRALAAGGAQ
jgi:hypothetical protein